MRECAKRQFNFHVRQMRAFMPVWLRRPASEVISGELLSEIEEHEAGLGRELDAAGMGSFLKNKPSPLRQATGFYPPVPGLSPVLVTVDMRSIELLTLSILPLLLLWCIMVLLFPSARSVHPGWHILEPLRPLAITTAWVLTALVAGNVVYSALNKNDSQDFNG
jgi:hypothetical protein